MPVCVLDDVFKNSKFHVSNDFECCLTATLADRVKKKKNLAHSSLCMRDRDKFRAKVLINGKLVSLLMFRFMF